MGTWFWVVVGLVAAAIVIIAAAQVIASRRSLHLRRQFGPEYTRMRLLAGGREQAEAELSSRAARRARLDIQQVSRAQRERYTELWGQVQRDFVDSPRAAVEEADSLVNSLMRDCGYPMGSFDQQAADISVDHPFVVETYRKGHEIYLASQENRQSTEEQRRALQLYRTLFAELLGTDSGDDPPLPRSQTATSAGGWGRR